jgi:hypothetical protein
LSLHPLFGGMGNTVCQIRSKHGLAQKRNSTARCKKPVIPS